MSQWILVPGARDGDTASDKTKAEVLHQIYLTDLSVQQAIDSLKIKTNRPTPAHVRKWMITFSDIRYKLRDIDV